MLFIKIIRFFTGYVVFRAYGGFGERFINVCRNSSVPLWNVSPQGDEILACTTIDGYKRIIPCARKSSMRTKTVSRKGLPFIAFRYRNRKGLAVGLLVMIITLSALSGRIWLIEVSGNESVPDEDIIRAVNDAGIRIGSKRSSFNAAQCAITAESRFAGISRIAITVRGAKAEITVKENPGHPDITDNAGYYNVVSSTDAQLVVLEAYSGTPRADILYPVLRGQTLISGINVGRDESVSFVHAHGYAVGRTEKEIVSTFDANLPVYEKRTVKRNYQLFILGRTFEFGRPAGDYDSEFRSESYLSFNHKKMPVGIFSTEYSSAEKSEETLSGEDLKMLCLEDYADKAESYVSSRQLIDIHTSCRQNGSAVTYGGTFVCYENIGREEPFEVAQTE